MKNCPICAEKLNKRVCSRCGYDETADFIEYRTLVKPKKKDTDRWKACIAAAETKADEKEKAAVEPVVKETVIPEKVTVKTEPHKTETASKAEKPFENDKTKKSNLKILMTIRRVSLILVLAFTVIAVVDLSLLVVIGLVDSATANTLAYFFGELCFYAFSIAAITTICIWIGKMKNKH